LVDEHTPGERVNQTPRKIFSFDYETFLIQPGQVTPPAVCMAWTPTPGSLDAVELLHARFDRQRLEQKLIDALSNDTVIGAKVSFDMLVTMREFPHLWELVFAAYEESRVYDVQTAQKLLDIAEDVMLFKRNKSQYSLGALCKRHLNVNLDKDSWRLLYGEFYGTPISGFVERARQVRPADPDPEGVIRYPQWDARGTLEVCLAQGGRPEALYDIYNQTRAEFWIDLMVAHGMVTDPRAAHALGERVQKELEETALRLRRLGLLRADGSRNEKAAAERMVEACRSAGVAVKTTDSGAVSLDEEACESSGDTTLQMFARYTSLVSLSSSVPKLKKPIIQSRFDLADTGRSTCSESDGGPKRKGPSPTHGYQLQNPRKEPGVRECFVPRPGCLFLSVDYGQMELHTWSQCCLSWVGHSQMAKALNNRVDVHVYVASRINNWDYEVAFANKKQAPYKKGRQAGKAVNFGLPGALGAGTLQIYAKTNYAVDMTLDEAKQAKAEWMQTWPESQGYFAYIKTLMTGDMGTMVHLGSGRIRSQVYFPQLCNGAFQGLAADCAKDAGFHLAKACYLPKMSNPLYGSRIVNFVHDEFILEVPEAIAHECAQETVKIMEDAGRRWCPDVPPRAEPALMRRWMKAAEPVYENGRLVPWEPPQDEAIRLVA
jgi:hypothetical protein